MSKKDKKIINNKLNNNILNAQDYSSNLWYNDILMEGNYWDDYIGEDDDGDG